MLSGSPPARSSAHITQSVRVEPINLPALVVAVVVIVSERLPETEPSEAAVPREAPAMTTEAMTAESSAGDAEVSGSERPAEAGAATQMSTAKPATEAAAADPAQVSTTHSTAKMATTHSATKMAAAHSSSEMATAATTATTTAAARQCVGRDAGTSRHQGRSNHRDFVQRQFPHDSFLSFRRFRSSPTRAVRSPHDGATPMAKTYRAPCRTFA